MLAWTPEAREEFDAYGRQIRPRLEAEGADPEEVCADLRRHIEQEQSVKGEQLVTAPAVREILLRLGEPEALAAWAEQPPNPIAQKPGDPQEFGSYHIASILFGVILPLGTILIEAFTHMCAEEFFDPIPSWRHLLMVTLVPIGNLLVILSTGGGCIVPRRLLGAASWLAIVISAYYSLLFLPIAPLGVIMIIAYGWGLLPLAPLFSFIVAIMARRRARLACGPLGGFVYGVGLAVALLVAADIPTVMTQSAMGRAVLSPDESTRARAIQFLRKHGSRTVMERECYGRSGDVTALWSRPFFMPVETANARRLYYRVTGEHYARPDAVREWISRGDIFDFDADVAGGELVGPVQKRLALASSRLDGSLAADGAFGYLEWTMEFRNKGEWETEARAQLALPAGGAVTRLTLWVGDREREAVFAGKAETTRAYQQVAVRERRDPVLVTTCGPDQVLMRCSPVPAHGKMKARIGITFPLLIDKPDGAAMAFPRILDRNFEIGADMKHAVWVESRRAIQCKLAAMKPENPKPGLFALRGQLADAELGAPDAALMVQRDNVQVWSPDPVTTGSAIVQRIETRPANTPSMAILVIDGSAAMRDAAAPLADAIARLPEGIPMAAIMAGDKPDIIQPPDTMNKTLLGKVAEEIKKEWCYTGGADNVPALMLAWDIAAGRPGSVIVWIHGPQPIELSPAARLIQAWERRPGAPRLLSLAAMPGGNRLLEELGDRPEVETVPRLGAIGDDMQRLAGRWINPSPILVRERIDRVAQGEEVSSHLARLWALGEARRLAANSKDRRPALELAANYRLVTPLTGAVVLETDAQYQQNNLKAPVAVGIPTVPEPGDWALIALCLGALAIAWFRLREKRCAA
ncbi:hypothetical protein LLG95_14620 [bacterium]|nr:hypothetical protein [bacterium]